MKKQIEVWEGVLREADDDSYYSGLVIDGDTLDSIIESINCLEDKKIRITVEVIE